MHAGHAGDRHNREDRSYRSERPEGSYDAWYASLGRSLGQKVYLTADYATSLAVIRVVDHGAVIERRPRSKRYGLNGVWNVSRAFSLIATAERLDDDASTDERLLLGLIYRF